MGWKITQGLVLNRENKKKSRRVRFKEGSGASVAPTKVFIILYIYILSFYICTFIHSSFLFAYILSSFMLTHIHSLCIHLLFLYTYINSFFTNLFMLYSSYHPLFNHMYLPIQSLFIHSGFINLFVLYSSLFNYSFLH